MGFWSLRVSTYRHAASSLPSRRLLAWDVARLLAWSGGFIAGLLLDAPMREHSAGADRQFMIALCTFSTFLASFVMAVMANASKRDLNAARNADAARKMKERLAWLLSDQLLMVVSALAAAASGLVWLACVSAGQRFAVLTATATAFGVLAIFNALRLPVQIWELQSTSLEDEHARAVDRISKEVDDLFK